MSNKKKFQQTYNATINQKFLLISTSNQKLKYKNKTYKLHFFNNNNNKTT